MLLEKIGGIYEYRFYLDSSGTNSSEKKLKTKKLKFYLYFTFPNNFDMVDTPKLKKEKLLSKFLSVDINKSS
nr:hypothetical protein [Entomoplasma sp. MP1]